LSRRSKVKQPKRYTVTFTANDFLPTTREDMDARGWDYCDIILVSGDAYIDSPFIGVAMVGRMLERMGYRLVSLILKLRMISCVLVNQNFTGV